MVANLSRPYCDMPSTVIDHVFSGPLSLTMIDPSPPGQNGCHFADNILKCIFMNEKFCISIQISLKFIPKGPIFVHFRIFPNVSFSAYYSPVTIKYVSFLSKRAPIYNIYVPLSYVHDSHLSKVIYIHLSLSAHNAYIWLTRSSWYTHHYGHQDGDTYCTINTE